MKKKRINGFELFAGSAFAASAAGMLANSILHGNIGLLIIAALLMRLAWLMLRSNVQPVRAALARVKRRFIVAQFLHNSSARRTVVK